MTAGGASETEAVGREDAKVFGSKNRILGWNLFRNDSNDATTARTYDISYSGI